MHAPRIHDTEYESQGDSYGQNDELKNIRRDNGLHPTEGGIQNNDGTTDKNSPQPGQSRKHVENVAHCAHLRPEYPRTQNHGQTAGQHLGEFTIMFANNVPRRDRILVSVHLRSDKNGYQQYLQTESPQTYDVDNAQIEDVF